MRYLIVILIVLFSNFPISQTRESEADVACTAELRWCNLNPPLEAPYPFWSMDRQILHLVSSHTFWLVNDGQTDWIMSAKPTSIDGEGYMKMLVWKLAQSDTCQDSEIGWYSGMSPEVCPQVESMLYLARHWPKNIIYKWWGPNSNSAARYLGEQAGFEMAEPPVFPMAFGWGARIKELEP